MEPVLSAPRLGLPRCFLVQLNEYVGAEDIFTEYAYFSSFSHELARARRATTSTMITERLGLDGRQLRGRAGEQRRLPAAVLRRARHPVPRDRAGGQRRRGGASSAASRPTSSFFGTRRPAQLAAGRPDRPTSSSATTCSPRCPTSTTSWPASPRILKPEGTVTIEFPHLMRMLEENQFDTIYHEHFCYFSLISAEAIFAGHGLTIFDVEELWTHGGSLRIYARHTPTTAVRSANACVELRAREEAAGYRDVATYARLRGAGARDQAQAARAAHRAQAGRARRSSATARPARATRCSTTAASAPTSSTSPSTATRTSRAGSCPGTHIPIHAPEQLDEAKPDYILILPWNFKDEIIDAARPRPRVGRAVHRADPRGRRCSDVLAVCARAVPGAAVRSCVSARTATTSRSAAAARSCACSATTRARRCAGSCSRPTTSAKPRRAPAPPPSSPSAAAADGRDPRFRESYFPSRRRRDQGRLRGAQGGVTPDLIFTHRATTTTRTIGRSPS